jgi:DNA primase
VSYDDDEQLQEIRQRLSSPRHLIEGLGLEGHAEGGGYKILCPAHNERSPSCSLSKGDDGTLRVKCFGCDLAGDVFTLLGAIRGLNTASNFPEIKGWAAELANVSLGRGPGSAPRRPAPPPPPRPVPALPGPPNRAELAFDRGARALLALCPLAGSVGAGLAFRGILAEAQRDGWGELPPEAWRLTGRDLEQAEANGFATEDRARLELLQALAAGRHLRDLVWLIKAGSIVHGEHRMLIPWRRPSGEINELQRRYATRNGDGAEKAPDRTPKYLFANAKDYAPQARYAYGVESADLAQAEEIWVVEGAVDVLAVRALNRARQAPLRLAALGLPGVAGWKQVSASVLAHVRGRVVRVALDNDAEPKQGVEEAIEKITYEATRAGARECRRAVPPGQIKDWGDYCAVKLGRAA